MFYCLNDEDYIHLIGTRDWQYLSKDHAYVIYSVEKCTEGSRILTPLDPACNPEEEECESYDPECASLKEINEWLEGKKSMFLVTQYKADFAIGSQLRQNEVYLPSVPLSGRFFNDVGYRYRKNNFEIEDDWYTVGSTKDS